MNKEPPRWKYRFDKFQDALNLLREGVEKYRNNNLSDLEKEGLIKRFEFTWELAKNLIKDYLEEKNETFDNMSIAIIRKGISTSLIKNREVWTQALDDRNSMSHEYNRKSFEEVIENIDSEYLSIFEQLYIKLLDEFKDE